MTSDSRRPSPVARTPPRGGRPPDAPSQGPHLRPGRDQHRLRPLQMGVGGHGGAVGIVDIGEVARLDWREPETATVTQIGLAKVAAGNER